MPLIRKKIVTYGFAPPADLQALKVKTSSFAASYELLVKGQSRGMVSLTIGGRHNAANSLAAIGAALELGIDLEIVKASLNKFTLPERRFQVLYSSPALLVIDDYAHHPSEIRATLQTLRSGRCRRVIAVFQPHRFTRLRILMRPFTRAFRKADLLVIAKLYAANQDEIAGVSSQVLAENISRGGQQNVFYLETFAQIREFLKQRLQDGDGVAFLSAGNLTQLAHDFAADMEALKK